MFSVDITRAEVTSQGEIVEAILDASVTPAIGMILIDEESRTWEITAMLHDAARAYEKEHKKLWTFQCSAVNADVSIHEGEYKLMH